MEEEFERALAEDIKEAEKAMEEAEKELEKAEAAGVDVTKEREELEEAKDRLRRIKSVYGII